MDIYIPTVLRGGQISHSHDADARVLYHMACHEQGCDRLSASSLRHVRNPIARYGLLCGSPSGSTLRYDDVTYNNIRKCRRGMFTRGTLWFGESLMPFRQIVDAGRIRRVSPYAISSMPFRQFDAVRCPSETVCLHLGNRMFTTHKHMVYAP